MLVAPVCVCVCPQFLSNAITEKLSQISTWNFHRRLVLYRPRALLFFLKIRVEGQGHEQSKCEINLLITSTIHIWKSVCSIRLKFSPKLHAIRTSDSGGIRGHVSNVLHPISPKRFITGPSNRIWSIALAVGYLQACNFTYVSFPIFKVACHQNDLENVFTENSHICTGQY